MARNWLGLEDGPVGNLTRLLEGSGIVIAFMPLDERTIQSYSGVFAGRGIILTNARLGDRYRARYYVAHELAHIFLHRNLMERRPTDDESRAAETAADAFAAEFLMPAEPMLEELYDIDFTLDTAWPTLLSLKERWGVEMSSLVRRAREIGVISARTYNMAEARLKTLSAEYRRREQKENKDRDLPVWINFNEPGARPGIEIPEILPSSMAALGATSGDAFLSIELGIPQHVLAAIGSSLPQAVKTLSGSSVETLAHLRRTTDGAIILAESEDLGEEEDSAQDRRDTKHAVS